MPFSFKTTQETKKVITDKMGNRYFDFIEKDIKYTTNESGPIPINMYFVPKENVMRIDLVGIDLYNDYEEYTEMILKFNGISNPLSIDEGDILIMFDPYSAMKNMRTTFTKEDLGNDIRNQYLAPEKKSKIDPKLKEFEKRNKQSTQAESTNLPPNYAGFGEQEIEIKGGKIYLGPNVSKIGGATDESISKSDFIARLVKNSKK